MKIIKYIIFDKIQIENDHKITRYIPSITFNTLLSLLLHETHITLCYAERYDFVIAFTSIILLLITGAGKISSLSCRFTLLKYPNQSRRLSVRECQIEIRYSRIANLDGHWVNKKRVSSLGFAIGCDIIMT